MEQRKRKKPDINTGKQESKEEDNSDSTSDVIISNPLLDKQQAFLQSLSKNEREAFFSESITPERRAEIWQQQAEIGEELINQYSWACPDERAIRILRHFSPLVEIGCGANAYWCRIMNEAGIDILGFDGNISSGGKIQKRIGATGGAERGFPVQQAVAEVLSTDQCRGRNLFLCYPDEDDDVASPDTEAEPNSLGASCLEHFSGMFVIHVGEIYGDTLSMEQAPWGRSSSSEFQQRLAAEYHCLLKVRLSSWVHVRDTLSVWKRSQTCSIVFATDEDDDDDEEEEVQYRHVPADEQLPTNVAAPCLAHLL